MQEQREPIGSSSRYLYSAADVARAKTAHGADPVPQRRTGGNGLRVHDVYFIVVSVVALTVVVGIIALASGMA